jgi:hypothetical protein
MWQLLTNFNLVYREQFPFPSIQDATSCEGTMTISAETFFKPERVSAEDKLALTTKTAKNILAREAAERAEKNERLRALRLAHAQVT